MDGKIDIKDMPIPPHKHQMPSGWSQLYVHHGGGPTQAINTGGWSKGNGGYRTNYTQTAVDIEGKTFSEQEFDIMPPYQSLYYIERI